MLPIVHQHAHINNNKQKARQTATRCLQMFHGLWARRLVTHIHCLALQCRPTSSQHYLARGFSSSSIRKEKNYLVTEIGYSSRHHIPGKAKRFWLIEHETRIMKMN
jgi:hypothetical protein